MFGLGLVRRARRMRDRLRWQKPWAMPGGHYKGPYHVLSDRPFVIYAADWVFRVPGHPIGRILRAVRDRPACILVRLTWTHEKRPQAVALLKRWTDAHRRRHPLHRIAWCCNTAPERERFAAVGLEALFCNLGAFSDERIYRPLADAELRFDAIYDARLSPFKRHQLAAEIGNLALVTKRVGEGDVRDYETEVHRRLAHAHWFNDPFRPDYRVLSPPEVNAALNRCRVGLALSESEGAMMSNSQYLLAGLPVVSTVNVGGRDEFYGPDYALTVPPDPFAIAEAVRILIARAVPREAVRAAALSRMLPHRERLIDHVQRFYDEQGAGRRFRNEWPDVFCNYLLDNETSADAVIARVAASDL